MPDIKGLSIAVWRLEKWINNLNHDRKMAANSSLRIMKEYIKELGVEMIDPIGSRFDPGLAVEVINNEAEEIDDKELIIIETVVPYIYQNGVLIQRAKVIIGSIEKKKELNESYSQNLIKDETKLETRTDDKNYNQCEDSTLGLDVNLIERIKSYAENI